MQGITKLSTCLLLVPAAANSALADDFYVGAAIGLSSIDVGAASPLDERATGWQVFGGYEFGEILALEAGYADFGSFDGSETVGGVTEQAEFDISGIDLFVVGRLPLGSVDAFAKLGVVEWEVDLSASIIDPSLPGPPITFDGEIGGTDLAAGLGLRYDIGESFRLRGEVEWFDIGNIDGVFVFSLGAVVAF